MAAIHENDLIFSNHRCHGHFWLMVETPKLYLQLMGKASGVCVVGVDHNIYTGEIFIPMASVVFSYRSWYEVLA